MFFTKKLFCHVKIVNLIYGGNYSYVMRVSWLHWFARNGGRKCIINK